MVDIHHHLLPGVDDGAPDMKTTIEMVRMAVESGTTHIVATPHANTRYLYDRDEHEAILNLVRSALPDDLRSYITLGLGSDFHLTFENIEEAIADPARFSINGLGWLMVELPDMSISPRTAEILYDLRVAGMTPVLTHPERNASIQRKPEMIKSWIEAGLLLQITAGSFTGVFGPVAQKLSEKFLADNWVNVISSDAHSIGRRNPDMSEAYARVIELAGEETARRLFITTPLAAFEGKPVPPQPEPVGIYEHEEPKNWLQRLLGR